MTADDKRDPAGSLTFKHPFCPLCGVELDYNTDISGDYYACYTCTATWHRDGSFCSWMGLETQCGSVTVNPWTHIEFRCVLSTGHDGHHKHPDQASWSVPLKARVET